MHIRLVAILGVAMLTLVPAAARDTSSLGAFVRSCKDDAKGCHMLVHDAIFSARNAKYGCIPAALNADDAGDQLLAWLKGTADGNPKYEKEALSDLMWTGIDEVWPCKK